MRRRAFTKWELNANKTQEKAKKFIKVQCAVEPANIMAHIEPIGEPLEPVWDRYDRSYHSVF
jgi:hypothetical protein